MGQLPYTTGLNPVSHKQINMRKTTVLKIFLMACFANLLSSTVWSQNMNSPYSVYGIGDIDYKSNNKTNGMGGTNLSLQSSSFILNNNPASVAGLERSFLVVSLSGAAKSSVYKGDAINTGNSANQDMWIKGLSLGTKINKVWSANIGISQFSNVNYKFTGSKATEGSTTKYSTYYEGDGGLNEYYFVNAFSLGKHLSLGVRSSFLIGSINQSETIYDSVLETSIVTKQQDYLNNFRFQAGGIYTAAIGKKWDFSLGVKYIPATRLAANRSITVSQDGVAVVEDQFVKSDRFWLPKTYAAGISLVHKKKTTFSADYTYEDWSSYKTSGNGWKLINSQRLSAGVEFSKQVSYWNQPVQKKFYQLGAFVSNSYLQLKGTPIKEVGFTSGMGGRLGNSLLYSLSAEYGIRGTTRSSLIQEKYFELSFTLSYRDFLFSKGRRYN